VIRRARSYLKTLESQQAAQGDGPQAQLDFSEQEAIQEDAVRQAVEALDPDSMTPREALDALYELKKIEE
jgi:DNA mismatch repair protein MutS